MSNLWLALEGAWHVLLAGIILGAGLPAIFALGLRSLSYGTGKDADDPLHQPHLIGKIGAALKGVDAEHLSVEEIVRQALRAMVMK